jgi:hypothetical protein
MRSAYPPLQSVPGTLNDKGAGIKRSENLNAAVQRLRDILEVVLQQQFYMRLRGTMFN